MMAVVFFVNGLGLGTHLYTASSQDTHSRLMASQLLYGIPATIPIPDLTRSDFLVVLGANPLVSHGSVLTAPRIRERLQAIVKRGGRVDRQDDGLDWLAAQCQPFTPERTQAATGIDAQTVRTLARDLAATGRAAIYGRIGACAGQLGTLTSFLIDAVNLAAGNLDVPGGSVFGSFGFPGESWAFTALGALLRYDYRWNRSRIGGFGNVGRSEPATMLADEITTPGDRQIRALFVSAGNRCCRRQNR